MKKKVILFDIDHTLFNGHEYRKNIYRGMAKKAHIEDEEKFIEIADEAYLEMRKVGPFIPDIFPIMVAQKLPMPVDPKDLEEVIWLEETFRMSLFEETLDVLQVLSKRKDVTLGIFSTGSQDLQRAKIKTISEFFPKEHMHIFLRKDDEIMNIIQQYKDDQLYLIDDYMDILYNAKRLDKNVYTVWVKRGWVAMHQKPIKGFTPDMTVTNLREILPLFDRRMRLRQASKRVVKILSVNRQA